MWRRASQTNQNLGETLRCTTRTLDPHTPRPHKNPGNQHLRMRIRPCQRNTHHQQHLELFGLLSSAVFWLIWMVWDDGLNCSPMPLSSSVLLEAIR